MEAADAVALLPPGPLLAPAVKTAGSGSAMPPIPTTGTSADDTRPSLEMVFWGTGILLVAWLIAAFALHDDNYPPGGPTTPVAGLTIFAVFFVGAQAIERLLEPFANYFDPQTAAALSDAAGKADDAARQTLGAKRAGDVTTVIAMIQPLQQALNDAAQKKAHAARSKANRKIVFWAIASAVGVLASAALKLYLLRTVGIATPNRPLEVLATGLIIGSGTQPLHDLVGLISAKADTTKAARGN